MKKISLSAMVATSVMGSDAQLEILKAQMVQMQKFMHSMQEKIDALESTKEQAISPPKKIEQLQERVTDLEEKNTKRSTDELETKIAKTDSFSASFSQRDFLPDIALILNTSAVARNVDNSAYENYAIAGFIAPGDAEIPFNKSRGFNFNYAEIALYSEVGPYFDALAIFHLQPDEFEIEEAYVTTRALPWNLRVKAGKFRSDFGRINSIHQHAWHFDDQPLVYEALFGPEGINDAGVQLQWIVPTETYLMAGIEAMQGTNELSFGDTDKNHLYVGYLKSSVDIGDTSLLLSGSIAHGKNLTANTTEVYGAALTTNTYLNAYASLIWQSELLYRRYNTRTQNRAQAGLYTQLVYKINKMYSIGARYDLLYKNSGNNPDDLDRYTAMAEYKPFAFSRLRLEYSHDRSKVISNTQKDIDTLIFSLNIAAGAHGAHAF